MFEMLRSQSKSASGAILYVTIGTLMMIWSGLWYFYFLRPDPNPPAWESFTCMGTILSGFAIAAIGLMFGLIGRGAKAADTTVGVAATPAIVAPTAVVDPAAVATPGATTLGVGSAPVATAPAQQPLLR